MPRVRRMSPAAEAIPRIMAGRTNCRRWAAGSFESSVNLTCGVQPHQMAGRRITTIAVTKAGIESPRIAALRAKKSSTPSWRTADRIPMGIPIRIATAMAMTPRVSVTGKRRASSPSTCCRVHNDSPRSPRAIRPSHSRYCTGIGRLSPSFARRSSRSLP